MLTFWLSALLASVVFAKAEWAASTVCAPNGICFEQYYNPVLNVTSGFALPLENDPEFPDELLMLHEFPLPYGYAGLRMGGLSDYAAHSLVVCIIFSDLFEAQTIPFNLSMARAEFVQPADNDVLTPLNLPQLSSTFSPILTVVDAVRGVGSATFIFRCQQCTAFLDYLAAAAAGGPATFTTLYSHTYPVYVDDARTLANVSSVGSAYQEITFDAGRARFANYSAMLEVAGLL
ncbi:hypothetical protein MKEN_00539200 [Mycena kentingensis (nom. inval.)]|nr:hypothetical protein MKEN_00539200 [Mycena kentingensis (nom. inval.)]